MKNNPVFKRWTAGALLMVALASAQVWAMEDDSVFTYTRIEADAGRSRGATVETWDGEGWIGTDYNRLWWKTEGDRAAGKTEDAEAQLLYSRYIAPFWDFQAGLHHDFKPDDKNYLAVGVRGLAPYAFDVDLALFARSDGKLFARTRAEYDLLITNRLIARPYVTGDWAGTSVSEEQRKGGLYRLETGLQVRYEFLRSFAPYLDWVRVRLYGAAREESATMLRTGIRLIF